MSLMQAVKQYFKKLFEVPKVKDPVLGLVYDDGDWWYGTAYFAPADKEIGLMIISGEQPPDKRHRQFYREIESHYSLIQEAIEDALFTTLVEEFNEFSRHMVAKCKREELWNNCSLESATVPAIDTDPLKWGLSYYCDWSDCNYDVHMEGWQVSGIENIGG